MTSLPKPLVVVMIGCHVTSSSNENNELIANTCIREGLFSLTHALRNFSYDRSVHNTDCSWKPHLVRSPRFVPESVCYTQSVMLSPRLIPESVCYTQSVTPSPRFISESVFHAKSVMPSLCFIPESVFYTQSVKRLVCVLYPSPCPIPQSLVRSPCFLLTL